MTERPDSQLLFVQTQAGSDVLGELSRQDEHLLQAMCSAVVDLSDGIVALPAPSLATAPSALFGGDTSTAPTDGRAPLESAPRLAYG